MKLYNQIYGNLSVGAGSWMNKNIFSKSVETPFSNIVINSFKKQVLRDLKRIKIDKKIKKMNVMDIGSGRQAAAMLKLGAKSVDHYDISVHNIKKSKNYCKNIKGLNSYCADIGKKNFNKHRCYDFIYMQGIIQHTRFPLKVLKNISHACREKGIVWLYHYQPTSLNYFYVVTLRKIFREKNLREFLKKIKKMKYSDKKINFLMDDLGCNYIHFYNAKYYRKVMENLGFIQFYKKDVSNFDGGISFNNIGACLTAYKKSGKPSNKKLIYKNKINLFNPKNYKKNIQEKIIKIKFLDQKIQRLIKNKKVRITNKINLLKPILDGYVNFKKSIKIIDVIKIYRSTYDGLLKNNLITNKNK